MMNALVLIAAAVAAAFFTQPLRAREELHNERSQYRNVVVYDDEGLRCMIFNKRFRRSIRQTCMDTNAPDKMVFAFTKMMMGALYLNPNPRDILVIGLGGGTLPGALRKLLPDARIDAVEVDPAVIHVAADFFGVGESERLKVHEADGRVFVKRAAGRRSYDLVMLDAFDEEYIPEHLLTRDFLLEVKKIMKPGAVLAANTFSNSALYDPESATYESVFGSFYNLRNNNRVILAQNGALAPIGEVQRNAAAFENAYAPFGIETDWMLRLFSTRKDWKPDARILTDQYAPSNLLNDRTR